MFENGCGAWINIGEGVASRNLTRSIMQSEMNSFFFKCKKYLFYSMDSMRTSSTSFLSVINASRMHGLRTIFIMRVGLWFSTFVKMSKKSFRLLATWPWSRQDFWTKFLFPSSLNKEGRQFLGSSRLCRELVSSISLKLYSISEV